MSVVKPAEFREALKDWLGDRAKFHPDWPNATTAGGWDAHGILHHWTAMSGKTVSVQRQVDVLRNGYPGLPGPLAHCAPTFTGDLWVVGWGNCNHAGMGDGRVYQRVLAGTYDGSLQGSREDVDGNAVLYGLEYMYHPSDGPMPDEQFEAGVLAACAIAQAHGWDSDPAMAAGSNLDHYEWAARKIDRERDNLANRTRAAVREALLTGPREDDMPTAKELVQELASTHFPTYDRDDSGKRIDRRFDTIQAQTHYRAKGARSAAQELLKGQADLAALIKQIPGVGADLQAAVDEIVARTAAEVQRLDADTVAERLEIKPKGA